MTCRNLQTRPIPPFGPVFVNKPQTTRHKIQGIVTLDEGQIVFVDIKELLAAEPKSLEESKGLVTADYQNFLEKSWIEQLRKKYSYKVDDQVLGTVGK